MGDRQGIRQLFTGATLRNIMKLPRVMSDILLGIIGKPGESVIYRVDSKNRDVYVDFIDALTNLPGMARLFIPQNILWRAPKEGESCMVLKPSEADGPGVPYAIVGDAGFSNAVPSWFGNTDCGISASEAVHIESTERSVQIQSNSGGATGASAVMTKDGDVTVNSGGNKNIALNPSGSAAVVVANGVLNVGRVTDTVTGQAGPYPLVSGQIASGTPRLKA